MTDQKGSRELPDTDIEATDWQSCFERLKQGDSAAASELFNRYSDQLVRLARQQIHPNLAKRFDGEDIVQSVFRTFFRRQQEGKFQIERAQQLWQLLVTITVCKTRSQARRHLAAKRDARNEQQLPPETPFFDRQALPEDALALWEEVDAALKGLPDQAAEIFASRLEGKNKTEIAEELNLTRQTIHRILKLVEARLIRRFQVVFPGEMPD